MKFKVSFKDGNYEHIEGDRMWDTAGSVSILRETGEYTPVNKPVYETIALYPLSEIKSVKVI